MKKLLMLIFMAVNCFGYSAYSGWCEQGGVKVTTQGIQSTGPFQQSYPNPTASPSGPEVTVYLTGTTTKATIYSDNNGTPLANPFPCAATGRYQFFATNGPYALLFSGTGISSFTIDPVYTTDGCPSNATCDAAYDTFPHACSAAGIGTLYVTKAWTGLATATFACNIAGNYGGTLGAASAAVLTFTGIVGVPPGQQLFNISAGGGAAIHLSPKSLTSITPQNLGAVEDGVTNDAVKIQGAMDSVCWSGQCSAEVQLLQGTYATGTTDLYTYHGTTPYAGFTMKCPIQPFFGYTGCNIIYSGSGSAIHILGVHGRFQGVQFTAAADLTSVVDYSGVSGIGIASDTQFNNVLVSCGNHKGDGFVGGAYGYQSDQFIGIDSIFTYCPNGTAFYMADQNDVFYEFVKCVIAFSHIGFKNVANAYADFNGGEIDFNDINFDNAIGGVLNVKGMRSENSKRQVANLTGVSPAIAMLSMNSYTVANFVATRPVTTAHCISGSSTVVLSTPGYIEGDWITLAGCGTSGADMDTEIFSVGTDLVTATVNILPSTNQAAAAVSLATMEQQDQFILNQGGGYTFINCLFAGADSTHPVTFFGLSNFFFFTGWDFYDNSWTGTVTNPFGANPIPTRLTLKGNTYDVNQSFGGPFAMTDYFLGQPVTSGTYLPVLRFGGSSTGITYADRSGVYSNINGLVTVVITITLSSKGSATGAATVTLPTTSLAAGGNGSTIMTNIGTALAGQPYAYVFGGGGQTALQLQAQTVSGNAQITNIHFTDTTTLILTLTYN
jgi:hypothetical protein